MSLSLNQVNLDIADEENVPESSTNPRRADNANRPNIVSTRHNHQRLTERLNTVIREIRPLVENARMGTNPRLSITNLLPRNRTPGPSSHPSNEVTNETALLQQETQSTSTHINLGPSSQSYVVNERTIPQASPRLASYNNGLNSSLSTESNLSDQAVNNAGGDVNTSVNPPNNFNIPDNLENDSQSDDGNQQILDVRALINLIVKYSPFYLILLIKFMYDRREGIFTFVVLLFTFCHSNNVVKREYGKQGNRSVVALFLELIYTISCISIVHLLFGHGKLLLNAVMIPTYSTVHDSTAQIDLWELLWLVSLTDLIVKIITVDTKIIVTAMPPKIAPLQKRGKTYLFIEATSQLYRSILPIQPWLFYLMQSYQESDKIVGIFLSAAYVVSKAIEVLVQLKLFKNATWTLLQSVNLGTKPSGEQLLAAGDSCPICHDDYTTPVRLDCGHIFCELCITAWLDREHTCPLCRAKVADEPTWRDGSTTYYFQLY